MNKLLVGMLCMLAGVSVATAQSASQDLGGVGQAISQLALSARGGTGVNLQKKTGGVLYLPYPAFHSADGKTEYGALGVGASLFQRVNDTALSASPLLLPMANLGGITSYLTGASWAKSHLSFASIGNVSAGIGVLPLPVPGGNGKWVIGRQLIGVVTFGLGKSPGS